MHRPWNAAVAQTCVMLKAVKKKRLIPFFFWLAYICLDFFKIPLYFIFFSFLHKSREDLPGAKRPIGIDGVKESKESMLLAHFDDDDDDDDE